MMQGGGGVLEFGAEEISGTSPIKGVGVGVSFIV